VWPPSKFFEASLEDQALAVEFYETEMQIASYQSKMDDIEMRKNSGGNKGFLDE
jgi:hypothetical protein